MSQASYVVVDDADTESIKYTGPWTALITSEYDTFGSYGKPHMGTLHATHSNASFSFTFNGTWIIFFATQRSATAGTPGIVLPTVQCSLLVSNIASTRVPANIGNNQEFCMMPDTLSDGEHTVIVNVVYPQNSNLEPVPFLFDHLRYQPSPTWPLDNEVIAIYPPDSRMILDSGWGDQNYSHPWLVADRRKATFTMPFIGEWIAWYSYFNQTVSTKATTGTYTIDDGAPTTFDIPATVLSANPSFKYHQLLFQTPKLESGPHTLTVIYNGDNQENSTPINLLYLLIQNNTATSKLLNPPAVSSSFTTAPSFTDANGSPSSKSPVNLKAIIGGVVGGLVGVVVAVVVIFILLRRRRKERLQADEVFSIDESLCGSPPPIDPFVMSSDDIVTGKAAETGAPTGTDISESTAMAAFSETQKSEMQYAQHSFVGETPSRLDEGSEYASESAQRSSILHGGPQMTPLQNSRLVSRGSRVVLRDEDSGIRLSRGDVVLLPPEYTPS